MNGDYAENLTGSHLNWLAKNKKPHETNHRNDFNYRHF